jgi:hypothetical protein
MPICLAPCGQCCDDHWRDAFPDEDCSKLECDFVSEAGCTLDRKSRPDACNSFQCDGSKALSAGKITKEQLEYMQENCIQYNKRLWHEHGFMFK